MLWTTSTSFISGTGLKKCSPSTWPGRLVAAAIAVTLHDEVFDASSACGGQIASSLAKVSFLSGWFSVMASITRSTSTRASKLVAPLQAAERVVLARARRAAPRRRAPRACCLIPPRPRSSSSWLASTTVVGKARLGRDLGDARAHEAAADHTDLLDHVVVFYAGAWAVPLAGADRDGRVRRTPRVSGGCGQGGRAGQLPVT